MPESLARMTARSVVLSVLLGAHPASATVAELVQLTSDFDIKEATLRVALTRMVSAGDLVRSDEGYRLSDRLLTRQRRQDDALNPATRAWSGEWIVLMITAVGTDPRTRASFRTALAQARFGELRDGVWLRPDNLGEQLPAEIAQRVRVMRAQDDDPAELANQLWDLPKWSSEGLRLLGDIAAADDIPGRFVVAAGIVRHLLTDPMLPAELLPADWPGRNLRLAYANFATQLVQIRDATGRDATHLAEAK